MKEVVIASACRTAIGAFGETLKDSHAATIAAVTMKAAVDRAGIDPSIIDDVRYGCCMEPVDSLEVDIGVAPGKDGVRSRSYNSIPWTDNAAAALHAGRF